MKLGNIATVRSGLVLSRKQAHEFLGIRYPLLNLRCVRPEGDIDMDQLDVYDAKETLTPEYLTQVGDIVVRLSAPYTAVLINEHTANLVVSSNFIIIRLNTAILLPEYLFWLLNTPRVKREIYENTSSNMLGAIKAKYFAEFDVVSLSLSDQQKISTLNTLARQEAQLLHQLAVEKEKYYSQMINQVHKGMKRGN